MIFIMEEKMDEFEYKQQLTKANKIIRELNKIVFDLQNQVSYLKYEEEKNDR